MKLADLITDQNGGHMSHSKLWANVAYAVVTGILVWKAYKLNISDDLILYYLGIVALHATGSKFVGATTSKVAE
jgi:hypothetical protein